MGTKIWGTLLRILICAGVFLVGAEITRFVPTIMGWRAPLPAPGEDPQISHLYSLLIIYSLVIRLAGLSSVCLPTGIRVK